MQKIRLGRTGLMVTKTAMGCLPVQRCNDEAAIELLRAAYDGGINYFDTANAYSDSEKKIGLALSDVRDKIIISTKSAARDKETVLKHIENSLRMMKTDYIDLFQFHQVTEVPDPNDPNGAYAAAGQIILPPDIKESVGIRQAVHIEVEQGRGAVVFVDDGEGGAGDTVPAIQPTGQTTGEGGLAHAQPAPVGDDRAGGQGAAQPAAQRLRLGGAVGEMLHVHRLLS